MEAFRHPVIKDPDWPDKTWNVLNHAIDEIYGHNASHLSFGELYGSAYNMVLYKQGEKLYSGLTLTLTGHLREMEMSIKASQGSFFLVELQRKWDDHTKSLQMVRDIFMYLDRTFIENTKRTKVYDMGLNLWRDIILRSEVVQSRLQYTVLDLIHKERQGEVIDRGLLRNLIKMSMDVGSLVYEQDFEQPFLNASVEFYKGEAQDAIRSLDCRDYLLMVERRLNEEIQRVAHYMDTRTESKIKRVVEKTLIEDQLHMLVSIENSGLVNMLDKSRIEDLKRMCALLACVPGGVKLLEETMSLFLKESTKRVVNDLDKLKDPVEFVQQLLNDKDKYDKIVDSAFNNDKAFQHVVHSSFEESINANNRSPEFISLYIDDKLRKGLRDGTEHDLDALFDKVVVLFRFLQEKDLFEKYYKQHLAKRLLSQKSSSEDAERTMILKLKNECGYQFTSKLEAMFTDMKNSEDIMKEFYKSGFAGVAGEEAPPTISVNILTTGSWPTQQCTQCNLPLDVVGISDGFRAYYISTHNGRRVTWQTNLGTADIKLAVGGKKYELNVTTYQMCILMLFNTADWLRYSEIELATQIPPADLKRSLQSLALVKGKNILRKEPVSKDISENDVFHFNEKFKSNSYKVKINNVVVQKETDPEKQETRHRVEEDRKPHIEAAIVRIMKSRKALEHNNLVAEVTKQLQARFMPNPVMIKKRIEGLIEREFLERDTANRNIYKYVA